ncbi:hypothetical protein [Arachidicoccus soli]|uniref:Uncharacterized protein n=1 Tax=Arachidicoccus soli TaxID=2341117 RepID=A0A386HS21_9BACT|nr:hypothetical protein [Arachidicoccus soli]AYD48231.1 hypothetical protein D6B99_11845 [Arachidicoccus soli]
MAEKKQTYIAQRKAEIAVIQAEICALLGWNEMRYGQFIYDNGLDFINRYYKLEELIQCVERSRAFWNWWKVIWWNADESMLTFVFPDGFNQQRVYELYCHLHNIDPLLRETLPPATVWEDIKNIQKEMLCR